MNKTQKFLSITGLTVLAACGGTETINGSVVYDPATTSFAEMRTQIQSGNFCNGLPLVSMSEQPQMQPNGEGKITYVCSNAK